jgi:hypothetical protein
MSRESEKPIGSKSLLPGRPTQFLGTGRKGTDFDFSYMVREEEARLLPMGAKAVATGLYKGY